MSEDNTTLRRFDRELGAHDARMDAMEGDITEIKKDVKDVLKALQGHADQLAENRGRDKVATAGISLVVAAGVSWLSRHFGS